MKKCFLIVRLRKKKRWKRLLRVLIFIVQITRIYYDIIIVYENRLLNVLRSLRIIIPSEDIIIFIELRYNVINTRATICFIFIYVYSIRIYVPTINLEYDYLPTRVMRGIT